MNYGPYHLGDRYDPDDVLETDARRQARRERDHLKRLRRQQIDEARDAREWEKDLYWEEEYNGL